MKKSLVGVLCLISLFLVSCSKNVKDKLASEKQVTVYFTKASDELGVVLIPVLRPVPKDKNAYEIAVKELFLGPTLEEREDQKLNTEIPEGTRLIKIEEGDNEIKLDISSQFVYGGGAESIQARFRQLRETVLTLAKGKPVYLYIDGEKAVTVGGEGLEVPQPLDKKL